jgi:hypothetical protein
MIVRRRRRIMRNSAGTSVVKPAFASTKGLRLNTTAQGYEDVENEQLSGERFFRIGFILGLLFGFAVCLMFRTCEIQLRKLSTLRFWERVSKCMGQLLFYRDNVGVFPQSS